MSSKVHSTSKKKDRNPHQGSASKPEIRGDLRVQLIESALSILSEEGLESLSLRKVASRVGVSHAAPAHHFSGLPELLGNVCGVGFERLADILEREMHSAGDDPYARLDGLLVGYVRFAKENPGLISLMFNTSRDKIDKSAFGDSGQRAYAMLHKAAAPFEPIGSEPDSTETMIWSLVHGFAFLTLGGRFDNPGRMTGDPDVTTLIPRLKVRDQPQD